MRKVWKKIERLTIRAEALKGELKYRREVWERLERITPGEISKQASMAGEIESIATQIEFLRRGL